MADSISAPFTAAAIRLAVISTSGSSGIYEEITNPMHTAVRVGQANTDPKRRTNDMATTHSAPIDLYEESREGFTEEQHPTRDERSTEGRRPDANGDRDDRDIEHGTAKFEQVLGW
jgi:hypothetical protein